MHAYGLKKKSSYKTENYNLKSKKRHQILLPRDDHWPFLSELPLNISLSI